MGLSYQDLIAWQKAMDLVEEIYRTTRGFPKDELYGLTSQLRRAACFFPLSLRQPYWTRCRNQWTGASSVMASLYSSMMPAGVPLLRR